MIKNMIQLMPKQEILMSSLRRNCMTINYIRPYFLEKNRGHFNAFPSTGLLPNMNEMPFNSEVRGFTGMNNPKLNYSG